MKNTKLIIMNTVLAVILILPTYLFVSASDHDDGEMELKGRNLNLTDLYAFREDWQDSSATSENLVLVMNSNPRSLARQQYFFSTKARYEFHLSRVSDKSARPTGNDDIIIRFEFGEPDAGNHQNIQMTLIKDGSSITSSLGKTTSLADMNANTILINNSIFNGKNVYAFAGLREDSFFFDVERYFRVRGFLATGVNTLGTVPTQNAINPFRANASAVDFTAGYNVNSIVAKIPISLLQSAAGESVFDVWETISVPE